MNLILVDKQLSSFESLPAAAERKTLPNDSEDEVGANGVCLKRWWGRWIFQATRLALLGTRALTGGWRMPTGRAHGPVTRSITVQSVGLAPR